MIKQTSRAQPTTQSIGQSTSASLEGQVSFAKWQCINKMKANLSLGHFQLLVSQDSLQGLKAL